MFRLVTAVFIVSFLKGRARICVHYVVGSVRMHTGGRPLFALLVGGFAMSRGVSLFVMITVSTLVLVNVGRAQFATVINSPPTIIGDRQGFGSDTQLNVFDGGVIGISFSAGSPDGSSENVQVNISGGSVGDRFEAFSGSTVNISGGFVDRLFDANNGSTVNISGGSVGPFFDAFNGSTVNISGGSVGDRFEAGSGSTVNISGGSVGDRFEAFSGSTVTISGGEFRLDGVLIDGLGTVNVPVGASLSGTLADGSPFAFSSNDDDLFATGSLALQAATLPPIGPPLITASTDPVPLDIRQGQTLVVDDGGVVGDHFGAGLGSTVSVQQGGTGISNIRSIW